MIAGFAAAVILSAGQTGQAAAVNGPGSTLSQTAIKPIAGTRNLPYGLQLLARPELLPVLRDSKCLQDSSYDRSGGNGDSGNFVRTIGSTAVLADIRGPGCIYRFWSANAAGHLRIYFDGASAPTIDCDMQDLFLGRVAPFEPPLVGHRSGGWYCYMPIPFRSACRIEADNPGSLYYHVQWQQFPDGTDIQTFVPSLSAADSAALATVKALWSHAGHPIDGISDPASVHSELTVRPGARTRLRSIPGPGVITLLQFALESADRQALRRTVLRVYWDGAHQPAVEAPLGDFVGASTPAAQINSLWTHAGPDGLSAYWPMPFQKSADIEIENRGTRVIHLRAAVGWHTQPWSGDSGWFHAQFHRETTVAGRPYTILRASGRGHYVGENTVMQGDRGIGFLEGDELFSVDGEPFPSIHGTGTEDFYTGGWYFDEGPFNLPLHGCSFKDEAVSRVAAYRLQYGDCVPFRGSATFAIEHGGENDYPGADYASTAYWYQDSPVHEWTPIVSNDVRPAVYRIQGGQEAEELQWTGAARVVRDSDLPEECSGGGAVAIDGPATAVVHATEDGAYDLIADLVHKAAGAASITLAGPDLLPGASATAPVPGTATAEGRSSAVFQVHLRRGANRVTLTPSGGTAYVDDFRVQRAARIDGAFEAEDAVPPAQGLAVVYGPPAWSGRAAVDWMPNVAPELRIPITVPAAGDYVVSAALASGAPGFQLAASIDGRAAEPGDSLAAGGSGYSVIRVARIAGITQGRHVLTLTAPAATPTTHVVVDYVRLARSLYAGAVEAEDLKVAAVAGGGFARQDMGGFGPHWSGDAQMFFTASGPGATASLELPAVPAGTYNLALCFTTARDYGVIQVSVDDKPVGATFNGFSDDVLAAGRRDFGTVQLTGGSHRLTLTVVGRDARSSGYYAGLDAVALTPSP